MHGARGGAPKGKGNGNYRHGERTTEAISQRGSLRLVLESVREALVRLDGD
jgi:hypothetical protein